MHETFSLNCGTCTRAELLGVMIGLLIAQNGGHKHVEVQVDYEVVV